jgi:hypothetical protein
VTTLELVRALASAARQASDDEAAARAIIEAMHQHDHWFCRMTETPNGTRIAKLPVVTDSAVEP